MRKLFQCEICDRVYDSESEAIACEGRGIAIAKLPVGQRVLVRDRYPEDKDEPWVERTITEIAVDGHGEGYFLDLPVQIGKNIRVGLRGLGHDPGYRLLTDVDFIDGIAKLPGGENE